MLHHFATHGLPILILMVLTTNEFSCSSRKRHGSIMSQLKATESSYRAMGIENDSKLDSIKEDMLRLTQVKSKHFNTQAAQLESLRTKIDVLQKNHLVTKVLKSLYFVEVRRRFDQIPLADQRSNRWVFDPDQTTFGSWLEDEGNGNCLFYVFGKVCVSQYPKSLTII
jgi:hypothetical protein